MLETLAIAGYRSLRDVRLALGRLNVVTGANGSGKSSLYRALRLLADVARGRVVASLADEGGLSAALWAGPERIGRAIRAGRHPVEGVVRRDPVSLRLGFGGDDFGYAIDLGLPIPSATLFGRDPEIKVESVWVGPALGASNVVAARHGPALRRRDAKGEWRLAPLPLAPFESMTTHGADPDIGYEILRLRERMAGWRFYDALRSDAEAPARRPHVGTRTPALAGDGGDLAAALQTIREIGDAAGLERAVADAFPGSEIEIEARSGYFELAMRQHGLLRPLAAAELSDGTLRYLMLLAALASPRPPELVAINEPETSLHRGLLAPLARLVADAATHSQILVVTHAQALVEALEALPQTRAFRLDKSFGETVIADAERPKWNWPSR